MTHEEAIFWYSLGLYGTLGAGVAGLSLVMLARWAKQIFGS